MKYFIIAGERSGDLHGSNLAKALKSHDDGAQMKGFGGDDMKAQDVEILVHFQELAFMGIFEVIANFGKISRAMKLCKAQIKEFNPDAIVLIDYAGFNLRVAKFAKKQGYKVFFYISPKVWAWNKSRAFKLKKWVDKLFVILPFEKEFFAKLDFQVDYVGNPVADAVRQHEPNLNFLTENNLPTDKKIIALLPGSRKQEVQRLLPIMKNVADRNPQYYFVVAGVRSLPGDFYQGLESPNLQVVFEDTYNLLSVAHAAIVTSGTATLETALWNVPQVVVYKANAVAYAIGAPIVLSNIKYFSLVNLIADAEVVKELLQSKVNPDTVNEALLAICEGEKRKSVLAGYEEVKRRIGENVASETTAKTIVQLLEEA